MKQEFLERAQQIANDNISSQQQILKNTLDLLLDFSSDSSYEQSFSKNLDLLLRSVADGQPQMAALINVCRFVSLSSQKLELAHFRTYLETLKDKVAIASSLTAQHASALIEKEKIYATVSQSEFVLKTFEIAAREGKLVRIYVMESRPLFEGRQTARTLVEMGHRAILVSDASIGVFIDEIHGAIIGADSILSDGTVINKIGSYPLAVCCSNAKKNFFVVTSILKYDSEKKIRDFINKEESPDEIYPDSDSFKWPPSAEIRNFYFDKVAPKFITSIVTEVGIFSTHPDSDRLRSTMQELYGASGRAGEVSQH